MKTIIIFVTIILFAFSLNASNTVKDNSIKLFLIGCQTTVSTDCDGDGNTDYENTVSCEYAAAMAQQHADACAFTGQN